MTEGASGRSPAGFHIATVRNRFLTQGTQPFSAATGDEADRERTHRTDVPQQGGHHDRRELGNDTTPDAMPPAAKATGVPSESPTRPRKTAARTSSTTTTSRTAYSGTVSHSGRRHPGTRSGSARTPLPDP